MTDPTNFHLAHVDRLTLRAAVLKILMDRVKKAYDEAKQDMAALLGPEGRKNAMLGGSKVASVSVSKSGRATVTDAEAFTTWVAEHYPTEIETVTRVRTAFANLILSASQDAGESCSHEGVLDVPGITVGEPYPMVRKTAGADALIEQLWTEGRLSVDGIIKELE